MKNICNNWNLSDFKHINFYPDASVGEEYRAWQGCPTIAVTRKGRIFAGWYTGGAFEPCIHNYNVLVKSDDNGENWSFPLITIHSDYEKRNRNIDIQLWVDHENQLWVMWTVSPYYENSKRSSIKDFVDGRLWDYHREFLYTEVMICKDPDADELVWEKPRTMCKGFMRNKLIVTSSGRIIAPAYDYNGQQYKIRCSDDGGESFYDVLIEGKPDTDTYDEIAVCERRPGELRFLARTNKGYYVYADSFDNGDTWTCAKEYEKAPSTRCYYGKLKNGMISYVRNLYDRERDNRLKLNRETWVSAAAKEILICKITVDDVITNMLSEGSYLRRIVSKAKINVVEI